MAGALFFLLMLIYVQNDVALSRSIEHRQFYSFFVQLKRIILLSDKYCKNVNYPNCLGSRYAIRLLRHSKGNIRAAFHNVLLMTPKINNQKILMECGHTGNCVIEGGVSVTLTSFFEFWICWEF